VYSYILKILIKLTVSITSVIRTAIPIVWGGKLIVLIDVCVKRLPKLQTKYNVSVDLSSDQVASRPDDPTPCLSALP